MRELGRRKIKRVNKSSCTHPHSYIATVFHMQSFIQAATAQSLCVSIYPLPIFHSSSLKHLLCHPSISSTFIHPYIHIHMPLLIFLHPLILIRRLSSTIYPTDLGTSGLHPRPPLTWTWGGWTMMTHPTRRRCCMGLKTSHLLPRRGRASNLCGGMGSCSLGRECGNGTNGRDSVLG